MYHYNIPLNYYFLIVNEVFTSGITIDSCFGSVFINSNNFFNSVEIDFISVPKLTHLYGPLIIEGNAGAIGASIYLGSCYIDFIALIRHPIKIHNDFRQKEYLLLMYYGLLIV